MLSIAEKCVEMTFAIENANDKIRSGFLSEGGRTFFLFNHLLPLSKTLITFAIAQQQSVMTKELESFISNFKNLNSRGIAFANAFVYDRTVAEDITAEALSVLWDKLRGGEHIAQPQIYLFGVIRNKALEHLRTQETRLRHQNNMTEIQERDYRLLISSAQACDPELLYSTEVQDIINSAISELSDQAKSVFILSRFEGLSNADIAARLGIAPKTVEYHITKALKVMRLRLKDYLPLLLFFI